jgi:hypothetical protein
MSAIRYSGALRIRVTIVRRGLDGINEEYRCCISCPSVPGQKRCMVYLATRKIATHGFDSPLAFDGAAHEALSFALDNHWPVTEYAASDRDGGWIVSRSVKNSHVWL